MMHTREKEDCPRPTSPSKELVIQSNSRVIVGPGQDKKRGDEDPYDKMSTSVITRVFFHFVEVVCGIELSFGESKQKKRD